MLLGMEYYYIELLYAFLFLCQVCVLITILIALYLIISWCISKIRKGNRDER